MGKKKVKKEDLKELAKVYNSNGKAAIYKELRTRFEIKNPYFVFKRMCEDPDLCYNPETDHFETVITEHEETVFMSMDELCAPIIPRRVSTQSENEMESRSVAMDKLIHELIGDRLLELSKYVTIDSLSKRIIVDKTTLTQDGYQLVTH